MRENLNRKEVERTKKQIVSIRNDLGKKYAQSLVDKEGYLETENDVGLSCLFLSSVFSQDG